MHFCIPKGWWYVCRFDDNCEFSYLDIHIVLSYYLLRLHIIRISTINILFISVQLHIFLRVYFDIIHRRRIKPDHRDRLSSWWDPDSNHWDICDSIALQSSLSKGHTVILSQIAPPHQRMVPKKLKKMGIFITFDRTGLYFSLLVIRWSKMPYFQVF